MDCKPELPSGRWIMKLTIAEVVANIEGQMGVSPDYAAGACMGHAPQKVMLSGDEFAVLAAFNGAIHASAPDGKKCVDCAMDGEACPDCYSKWWRDRHPSTRLIGSTEGIGAEIRELREMGRAINSPALMELAQRLQDKAIR